MTGQQLDVFHQPADPAEEPTPAEPPVRPSPQLSELPGETFEDIFDNQDAA